MTETVWPSSERGGRDAPPSAPDVLEHLPDPALLVDADNRIEWSNRAALHRFGDAAAPGMEVAALLVPEPIPESRERTLIEPDVLLARARASGAEVAAVTSAAGLVEVRLSRADPAHAGHLLCLFVDRIPSDGARERDERRDVDYNDVERIAQIGHWRHDLVSGAWHWSAGAWRIAGLERTGKRVGRRAFESVVHPDDIAGVEEEYQRALDLGEPFDASFRLALRDGTVRWVHARAEACYDATGRAVRTLGTLIDITARKAFENRLQASEERFALAMQGANEGVWDWDLVSDDVYYSPRWFTMLGYEPGDWPYRLDTWATLVNTEDRPKVLVQVGAYLDGKADFFEIEQRMRHRDGHDVWVLARALKVTDDDDRPIRLVGTHLDLSERRQYEEQLRESQKMEAVGRLVGGIAHDFNNVLAAIQGNVHLARAGAGENVRVARKLETIDGLVGRAAQTVGQLLTFARRDAAVKHTFSLLEILREGYLLAGAAVPTDIGHEVDFCDAPLPVVANAVQLQQVLVNLVSNAVDAVRDVAAPQIRVRLSEFEADEEFARRHVPLQAGSYARLDVEDNGHGIAEADLANIFDPFFTTKEVGRGTGLGLATAFGAVHSHDGVIEVETAPGEGTCFSVYLPLSGQQVTRSINDGQSLVRGRGETILLVDDDPAVRKATGALLRSTGYSVIEAGDGEQALRLFRQFKSEIGLVVTDVVMPRMGGVALRNALNGESPTLPVLLVTGYDRERVLDVADNTGSPVVTKPFDLRRLTHLIRTLLDEHARAAEQGH